MRLSRVAQLDGLPSYGGPALLELSTAWSASTAVAGAKWRDTALVEGQAAALRDSDMDDFAFAETKARPGRDAAKGALTREKAGHSRNHALDCVARDDEVLR